MSEKRVEPAAGETQDDFMGRCVPAMIDEGKDQDQAVAMCSSMWEKGRSAKPGDRELRVFTKLELREAADRKPLITGYAAVFNQRSGKRRFAPT